MIKKLNTLNTSEQLASTCGLLIANALYQQDFSSEGTKALVQTLESSIRLDNQFWFSRIDDVGVLKEYGPAYVSLLERKAVQAALSSETPSEYFLTAIAVIANIHKSGVLDHTQEPLPHRDELIALMKQRLDEQLVSQDKLLEFYILDPKFVDNSGFFAPKMQNFQLLGQTNWPGIGVIAINSHTPRVNVAIAILEWFKDMDLISDIKGEALRLTEASSELELECYLMLEPSIVARPQQAQWAAGRGTRRTLNWPSLQFETDRNAPKESPSPSPSPAQWAAYFLYWKALFLLPKDQGLPAYQVRHQKLYQRYYPEYVSLRDRDNDGRLSVSEMFDSSEVQRMRDSNQTLLDGSPIEADAPLSQDDTIALMSANSSWRDFVQVERRGSPARTPESFPFATNPNPRNPARSPNANSTAPQASNEPTYQSKPLSHWLHLYDVERDPKELGNVVSAIKALITPETRHQIADHLLGSLPQRGDQEVVLTRHGMRNANGEPTEGDSTSRLDAQSFVIIRNCLKEDAFAAALQLALSKADDMWASRILENRSGYGFSELDKNLRQPIQDYAVAKLHEAMASDRLIRNCANLLTTELARNDSKPETVQTLISVLRNCNRLANEFWLKNIDDIESLKRHGPAYVSLMEEKAVNAALSSQTTNDYFLASMAIIATIHQSGMLDRAVHPFPHRDGLVALNKQKLADLLASGDKLLQLQYLSSELQDRSQFFLPKLNGIRLNGETQWPGVGIMTYTLQPIRSNVAFNLFGWFEAMGIKSEIEPLLPAFLEATSELELQCYLKLVPSIAGRNSQSGWPNRTISWPSLSIETRGNGRNISVTDNPTDAQWAAYFIYWKATDLLPEDQRKAATALRQEKLFRKYYPEYLTLRDKNKDGHLSVSEMASRAQLERMESSSSAPASDQSIDFDAILSEDDAIAFLLRRPNLLNNVLAVRAFDEEPTRSVPFANGGLTAPNRSRPSSTQGPEPKSDEPIYQGKPLSHWLQLFDVERDPKELGNIIDAIGALVSSETKDLIKQHLLQSLPARKGQQITRVDADNKQTTIWLDVAAFEVLRRCVGSTEGYLQFVADELKKADDVWARRILIGFGYQTHARSWTEQQCKPVIEYCSNILAGKEGSDELASMCGDQMSEFAKRWEFSEDAIGSVIQAMTKSERLKPTFWFSKAGRHETLQGRPEFPLAVEQMAAEVALTPDVSLEDFNRALESMITIRTSDVSQSTTADVPHKDQLVESLRNKLQQYVDSPKERREFYVRQDRGYGSLPSLRESGLIKVQKYQWPSSIFVSGGPRGNKKELITLKILDWFTAYNLVKEIDSTLQKMIEATSPAELEILSIINPNLTLPESKSLNLETMQLSTTVDGAMQLVDPQPTPDQWADYFIYWKSIDVLPQEKQIALLKARNEKLYKKYYKIALPELDKDKDGHLTAVELLDFHNYNKMVDAKLLVHNGNPIQLAAPLTEEAAIELLRNQPDPYFFGLRHR